MEVTPPHLRNPGWIGLLSRIDQRRTVGLCIARTGGRLHKAAHELGINRSHIYRLVRRLHLWPLVNQARQERITRAAALRHVAKTTPGRYRNGV